MPEQLLVPGLLWYNDNCALNQSEKLDGVAVNNEEFPKYGSEEELVDYITNLAQIGQTIATFQFYAQTLHCFPRDPSWRPAANTLLCWLALVQGRGCYLQWCQEECHEAHH